MVLLTAFSALVRRYAGASDFLVSVPVTERSAAAEAAIGYFGNIVLLRIVSGPDDTFAALTDTVRETCLGGFAHRSVGIDRVVRAVNPQRSAGRDGLDRLVRLGFSMRKSVDGFSFDGVTARQLELGAVTAQLPLSLAIVFEPEDPEQVAVEFEYHVDVLAGPLVDRMLTHYLRLLDNALRAPGIASQVWTCSARRSAAPSWPSRTASSSRHPPPRWSRCSNRPRPPHPSGSRWCPTTRS
ncbi:condensation domain protein [Mycobacterium kansasii 824]|nr:condensation domain protein [Mycobacterium kansasii 824]